MDALVDRPDVLAAQPPGDANPQRDEEHVDRGRAAQAQPEAGNQREPLRRDAEQQRPATIRDAVDDDVDGVLERDALAGRNRQIEQLVARLVHREPEPLIEGVGEEHGPQAGTSKMNAVPNPSESGRMRTVTAMPKRRSAGPVTSNCRRKLTLPA